LTAHLYVCVPVGLKVADAVTVEPSTAEPASEIGPTVRAGGRTLMDAPEDADAPVVAKTITVMAKVPVFEYVWSGPLHVAPSAAPARGPEPSP
jgi:hypothetical protein